MPFHELGILVIISMITVPTLLNRFFKTIFLFLAKGLHPVDRKPDSNLGYDPSVVIQVAISNEPSEIVLTTLESLARLDYPKLLVQVIDNNTLDDQLWRPVEAFCQRHSIRFIFYHVEQLSGYKAGALDYALKRIPSGVELIGIVPEDESVVPASNNGLPVTLNENSRAGTAFRNIARRLIGEKVPFMELEESTNFLQRLARRLTGGQSE